MSGRCRLNARRAHFAFALWAIHQPATPKVRDIVALTGLSYESARKWRIDWIEQRGKTLLRPEDDHANH